MEDLDLLIDLHRDTKRQGPGGSDETDLSITLSGLRGAQGLNIADIGCGTGSSTLVLTRELDASITAVDLLPQFLDQLEIAAKRKGLSERIKTLAAPMDALPFEEGSFDAIWAEGAIYNIGFERGIKAWRHFLKPGGILAVSELTWLTQERPAELQQHWMQEYPQVHSVGQNGDSGSKRLFTGRIFRASRTMLAGKLLSSPAGAFCRFPFAQRPLTGRTSRRGSCGARDRTL